MRSRLVESLKRLAARQGRGRRSGPLAGLVLLSILWVIVVAGVVEVLLLMAALVAPSSAAAWLVTSRRRAARARAEADARLRRRRAELTARFGPDLAAAMVARQVWNGATAEMLREALGPPDHVEERRLEAKTRRTYFYDRLPRRRYALRVRLEDDVVIGWTRA